MTVNAREKIAGEIIPFIRSLVSLRTTKSLGGIIQASRLLLAKPSVRRGLPNKCVYSIMGLFTSKTQEEVITDTLAFYRGESKGVLVPVWMKEQMGALQRENTFIKFGPSDVQEVLTATSADGIRTKGRLSTIIGYVAHLNDKTGDDDLRVFIANDKEYRDILTS